MHGRFRDHRLITSYIFCFVPVNRLSILCRTDAECRINDVGVGAIMNDFGFECSYFEIRMCRLSERVQ